MIRYARLADAEKLFNWRNSDEIRQISTNQDVISWANHSNWFLEAIKQKDTLLFVIDNAGSVRVDRIEDYARISIYLLKEYQGKGLGVTAINQAVRVAFNKWHIKKVVAHIKTDNEPSIKAFTKAGFIEKPSSLDGHKEYVIV